MAGPAGFEAATLALARPCSSAPLTRGLPLSYGPVHRVNQNRFYGFWYASYYEWCVSGNNLCASGTHGYI